MAKADHAPDKALKIGDVATFEVVTPHYGLKKGETRKMSVTRELLECIEAGLWKLKK